MKLLLDVGNSRIKWAFATAECFVAHGEAVRDEEADLRPLFDTGQRPDEIRIANVAGSPTGARIAARLEQRFHVEPIFARAARTGAGVLNGYADSGQLGVDRWLAICAGYDRYRAAVCVVSAGTATTIDLVTDSGEHHGGLILPGLGLMELALMRGTSDLAQRSAASSPAVEGRFLVGPGFDPEAPVIALGRDTAAAMHYGALQATTSLVWACLEEFSSRASPVTIPPTLLVTGGAASALQAALRRMAGVRGALPFAAMRLDHRPQLVLEGLALDPPCFVANQ
jgi:type III pantothenate kinase